MTSHELATVFEGKLKTLQAELSAAIGGDGGPQFDAMAETTAEALNGLASAFADYREGEEDAWREDAS